MSIHYDNRRKQYYVKYKMYGKSHTSKCFNTKSEAKKYEAEILINKNKYINKKYKVYDVIDMYLNHQKTDTEYSTYQKSKALFENIIKPNLDNMYINVVTPMQCEEFKAKINTLSYSRKDGGKIINIAYKTPTKNDILQRFKSLFNYAYRNDLIDKDPCRNLTKFKKTFEEEQDARERDYHIWDPKEFNIFIQYVKEYKYQLFFTVLYYTGLRKSECLALTWKDYYDASLDINKSKTRKTNKGYYEIKKTKTKSSVRRVYLPKFLDQILTEFKQEEMKVEAFSKDWYIFGREDPYAETTIDRKRKQAINDSNVKYITNHQFRHSYASYLIGSGIDIVAVSRSLGHSSIKITLDTYSHLLTKNNQELLNVLEANPPEVLQTFCRQK